MRFVWWPIWWRAWTPADCFSLISCAGLTLHRLSRTKQSEKGTKMPSLCNVDAFRLILWRLLTPTILTKKEVWGVNCVRGNASDVEFENSRKFPQGSIHHNTWEIQRPSPWISSRGWGTAAGFTSSPLILQTNETCLKTSKAERVHSVCADAGGIMGGKHQQAQIITLIRRLEAVWEADGLA